jgi:hypothetical protein
MTLLIVFAIALVGAVMFVNPKVGSWLVWFLLFTYPHRWWMQHQFLPLNAGVDDLFCLAFFAIVVFRRNFMEGVGVRFGYAFWVITSFTLIASIATIFGLKGAIGPWQSQMIKIVLKTLVYWALFYGILHCIDNKRDLKMQFTMFSLAAGAGGVLVILSHFFPRPMANFAAPIVLQQMGIEQGGRATGAFMNPNAAANMMVCCLVLVATTLRLQKTRLSQIGVFGLIGVLLVAALLTQSRAGLLALSATFLLMSVIGRHKPLAWTIVASAVVIALIMPELREPFQQRIVRTLAPGGTVNTSTGGRVGIWKRYFETAEVEDYIIGRGEARGIRDVGQETHSIYVSLLTVYGAGSVLWALASLAIFGRKVRQVGASGDAVLSSVVSGCLWALIAWGVYGLAADALSSQYSRYLLFFLVVLVDRAAFFVSTAPAAAPAIETERGPLLATAIQPA